MDVGYVALEGEITIYRAAEIKHMLQTELKRCAVLEVDLAGVTDIDSAGIQVLILAKLMARDESRELRLVHHSDAVRDVFERLALGRWFGDVLPVAL
ncbi:STAS domain-containing protein [Duganella ginsengisoli]|uniref:STAS domain-containing protein n=2 Tax=Pseudoduganella ginsengisoli TaxID=1462440 RepID=A0A6L6Q2A2_9BURK|nr:STAS domain-containing protein [Pseudoduganella ginsengisoli]